MMGDFLILIGGTALTLKNDKWSWLNDTLDHVFVHSSYHLFVIRNFLLQVWQKIFNWFWWELTMTFGLFCLFYIFCSFGGGSRLGNCLPLILAFCSVFDAEVM